MKKAFIFLFFTLHVNLYANPNPTDYNTLLHHIITIGALPILFLCYRYWDIANYNKKLCNAIKSFEILVESALEGIIIFDESMHCIMANQATSDIYGYTKEELLGKYFTDFIAKKEFGNVAKGFNSPNLPPHEILSVKKDGTYFMAWTRGVDAIWNDKKVRITSIIDITEHKNLQNNLEKRVQTQVKEIEKQNQLIQQQNKLVSMGEMIGAIAHQWRQPLNALNINIQNLEDDYKEGLIDGKFIDDFIEQNRKTIEFMSNTIDDFRNFFHTDKEKRYFSVEEAIKETLTLQSALLENYHIEVNLTGEPFKVHSFKGEFKQVILNLISNAKDAIIENKIPKGKIDITLKNNKITIEDNGGGINEEMIHRVFEPYFTTKEQGKGVGLGLYISKMIVEQNIKGSLSVKNGKFGAKFSIIFPKS